jgi:hypothetical protein
MIFRFLFLAALVASFYAGHRIAVHEGGFVDPNGRFVTNGGGAMDPNGLTIDDGRGIDPNG